MKRYFMSCHPELGVDAHEHKGGEWVKYDDVEFEMRLKDRIIHNLKRHIDDYCGEKKQNENMG